MIGDERPLIPHELWQGVVRHNAYSLLSCRLHVDESCTVFIMLLRVMARCFTAG